MKALNRRLDLLENRLKHCSKPALIKFYTVDELPTRKDAKQINKALIEERIVICFYAMDMSITKDTHLNGGVNNQRIAHPTS